MPPGVLRRCSVCGKFHTAYLVRTEGEVRRYCYACWKAEFGSRPLPSAAADGDKLVPQPPHQPGDR